MAIWKSRHRHLDISIGIAIVRILFLPYKKFYEKIAHLCQMHHNILSCTYLHLLISLRFSTPHLRN